METLELDQQEEMPHSVTIEYCLWCGYKWVAIAPLNADGEIIQITECPDCGKDPGADMMYREDIKEIT